MSYPVILFGVLLVTLALKTAYVEDNFQKLRAAGLNFWFGLFCIFFGLTLIGT